MRIFRRIALVLGFSSLVLLTAAAGVQAAPASDFAAQAKAAGLSTTDAKALQKRVDKALAETGGTQIAANKIDLKGATLTLVVPGEKHVRNLSRSGTAQLPLYYCNLYYFCAYTNPGQTGDMLALYFCNRIYNLPSYFSTGGSWVNNQTKGTQARLYYVAGGSVLTRPALSSEGNWNWVPYSSIRAC